MQHRDPEDPTAVSLHSMGYRRYLLKRTIAILCQRSIKLGPFAVGVSRSLNGRKLQFQLRDHLQCLFYFGVSSEPENSALIRALGEVAHGDLIDVGANYGQQPYEVSRNFRKMLLFEPNPAASNFVRDLFSDQSNVEVVEMGVSDTEGDAILFFPDEKQSGVAELRSEGEGTKIRVTTIDAVVGARDFSPCLIKIDVEGLEANVIQGAAETIRKHLPILAFESDSREHREACIRLLPSSWSFYHVVSDVKPALRKIDQVVPVAKALLRGSQTYVTRADQIDGYISLLFAVPAERDRLFHDAVASLAANGVRYLN